jgi:hypothetical protein
MNGYIKIFGKGQNSVVYNQLSSDSGGISFFNTGGNVGIGTTTPGYKLHVIGNTTITDVLLVQSTTGTGFIKLNATTFGTYGNIDMNGNFTMYKNGQNATISNYFSCELNGNSFFNTGGSVAIGTDQSNGYKLNVNGNIKCTEVIADNGSNYAIRDDISTSGNTSLTANDKNKLLVITPTVNITLTLPATNVVGKGAFYKIANRATAYTITINNSSNTAQLVLYPSQVGEIIALDSTSTGTWFVAAP